MKTFAITYLIIHERAGFLKTETANVIAETRRDAWKQLKAWKRAEYDRPFFGDCVRFRKTGICEINER